VPIALSFDGTIAPTSDRERAIDRARTAPRTAPALASPTGRGQTPRVRRRAVLTAVSCMLAAGSARAEPLPGRFEILAGGHLMMLFSESCEQDGDLVACHGGFIFAGFELGGRAQLGPWFALGARIAGSSDLDASRQVSSTAAGGIVERERSTWLWQFALQARFDPPLWPTGLWIGAEIGAAVAFDSVDAVTEDQTGADEVAIEAGALLLAAVVGWDFSLAEGVLFGFDVRAQYITLRELPRLGEGFGRVELDPFPYIALGVHFGARF
jgi:hypothetical protein